MRLVASILLVALLAGCANRYRIKLTNGSVITTRNRPRLSEDQTTYQYKDARGQRTSVPVFRVKEIEPL